MVGFGVGWRVECGLVEVVRVDPLKPDRRVLARVGRLVERGALVVYPTDTVYGVGTNPLLEDAVRRLYEAKKRPFGKPVPVLASSIEHVERIAFLSEEARRLAARFWPGPLTIVVPAKPSLPSIVTGGSGKVGVRVPAHNVARLLIEEAGGLIIGTSANISGRPPPRTAEEAFRELGNAVDVIVDAGPAPGGKPSTVIDLTTTPPKIVRKGPIGRRELEEVLGVEVVE